MDARGLITLLVLSACGPAAEAVPTPRSGSHEGDVPVMVPYPPPPPKVEVIRAAPADLKDPVWIDGQWAWQSRRWIWIDGKWEAQHPNGYYARPKTVMLADKTIAYFQGAWHDK